MARASIFWYAAAGAAGAAAVAWAINRRSDYYDEDDFRLPSAGSATLPSPAPNVVVLAPEWGVIRTTHVVPVQRALEAFPNGIGIVIHTLGGSCLAVDHIAHMLTEYKGRVTVYVPYMALSGGTMIALAADEIVMEPAAILGPVDPQLNGWPAVGILEAVSRKPPESVDDEWMILAAEARKSLQETRATVRSFVSTDAAVDRLTSGSTTHARPIPYAEAVELKLPVRLGVPRELVAAVDELAVSPPPVVFFQSAEESTAASRGLSATRIAPAGARGRGERR